MFTCTSNVCAFLDGLAAVEDLQLSLVGDPKGLGDAVAGSHGCSSRSVLRLPRGTGDVAVQLTRGTPGLKKMVR